MRSQFVKYNGENTTILLELRHDKVTGGVNVVEVTAKGYRVRDIATFYNGYLIVHQLGGSDGKYDTRDDRIKVYKAVYKTPGSKRELKELCHER